MNRPPAINVPAAAKSRASRRVFNRAPGAGLHRAAGDATIITMFGEVGWEITAATVHEALTAAAGADVTVRMNSPGGSFFDGVAVYNTLRAYPADVRIEVIGLAASAASLIAMAGDTVAVARNSQTMIHRVWSLAIGDAEVHRDEAGVLDKLDDSLAKTYAARTGLPLAQLQKMLAAETWMDGDQAVDLGFADELLEKPADASGMAAFDLSLYANAPASLKRPSPGSSAPEIGSRENLERILIGVLPRGAARKIARAGWDALQRDTTTTTDAVALLQEWAGKLKSKKGS